MGQKQVVVDEADIIDSERFDRFFRQVHRLYKSLDRPNGPKCHVDQSKLVAVGSQIERREHDQNE